jgi:hypothetical protein
MGKLSTEIGAETPAKISLAGVSRIQSVQNSHLILVLEGNRPKSKPKKG